MNKQTQEALKMAIYALEKAQREIDESQGKRATMQDWGFYQDRINACKEALEQPAQEPVLKVVYGEICYLSKEDDQSYGMWCPVTENYKPPFKNETNFYTHPHQWQGLTDDEIDKVYCATYGTGSIDIDFEFARAIEQELKEKNV